jgi:malate dehydrogenase (oxaloacetate-decarboxylating)(NADP+)
MDRTEERHPRGIELLHDPRWNQGTAFTEAERERERLAGLLPDAVEDIELQRTRVLRQLGQAATDLERYVYLTGLLDANETLFYRVLMADPARFLPIVYDPTIGEACLKFGHLYRRPRGLYLSIRQRGRVREVLRNWPERDVRFICVTTGERILGLGDLGANGMGIPIGKLQLYTACAAVPPEGLLPLLLDCGTNNHALLADPLYLGARQPRPATEELDAFVDEFVRAVQEVFPGCCIHFEDWKGTDALRLLAKYKDEVCCYDDDIQGTGSVTVAGLLSALRMSGGKLADQRILFLGAGSAGIGIADAIVAAMQLDGLAEHGARGRIWLFDVNGLIEPSRADLDPWQRPYAHALPPSRDFVETIRAVKPTAIIGVSTKGGAFTREVIETMAGLNERPIIFALSNPTDRAECTAEQAYRFSGGKAIYAAGIQFPPVVLEGRTFLPSQANNSSIFPAVSLAVYATRARLVSDEMFIEAARATADQVTREELERGMLFPPQSAILESEVRTAVRVATLAFDRQLAQVERPKDVDAWIRGMLYKPDYRKARPHHAAQPRADRHRRDGLARGK